MKGSYTGYRNHAESCLDPTFLVELQDHEASIEFSQKFLNRIRRLTTQKKRQRKEKYVEEKVRLLIKDQLGPGGHVPNGPTVVFDRITPDIFGAYLCSKRKPNGALYKPDGYKAIRAGLSYLYRR